MTCFNKEIRKAKCSSWRRYCQETDTLPGSERLIRIIAKQMTNGESTIKLPGSQYTQNGNKTLKELFRVHFPDSKL
jgi:hypothetical protein